MNPGSECKKILNRFSCEVGPYPFSFCPPFPFHFSRPLSTFLKTPCTGCVLVLRCRDHVFVFFGVPFLFVTSALVGKTFTLPFQREQQICTQICKLFIAGRPQLHESGRRIDIIEKCFPFSRMFFLTWETLRLARQRKHNSRHESANGRIYSD